MEIFMEYLKIHKKSDYNFEKRRAVEYGFDIERLTNEQKSASNICGYIPLEYDLFTDEKIVNYYVSYFLRNDFKQCIDDIKLRYKSEWLIKWIQNVKSSSCINYILFDFLLFIFD